MTRSPDDLSSLEAALEGFAPDELEDLQDILTHLESGDNQPRINGLRSISSQSLADIAHCDQQSLRSPDHGVELDGESELDMTTSKPTGESESEYESGEQSSTEKGTPQPPSPHSPAATKSQKLAGDIPHDDTMETKDKKCSICRYDKDVSVFKKLLMCFNCKAFFKRSQGYGRKLKCTSKNNNCKVIYIPNKKICSSCRLNKALSLGLSLEDSQAREPEQRYSQQPTELGLSTIEIEDPDRAIEIAMYESLTNYVSPEEDEWEPYNPADFDRAPIPQLGIDQIGRRKGPRKIVFSSTCSWSANGLIDLSSTSKRTKSASEEVVPLGPDLIVMYSNDISDDGISLLTKNREADEALPIEEIVTPVITLDPSIDLIKAEERENLRLKGIEPPMRAGDAVRKKLKPKLLVTLKVRRTIIDRRPMLKRLKTNGGKNQVLLDNPNSMKSNTLIGPGEDCDDSNDNEIYEVDCDNN